MDVGIDGRALVGAQDRGVARYTRALIGALSAAHPEDRWRIFVPGRRPLPINPELSSPNTTLVRHALPGRALFGAAAIAGRPRLDRLLGGDLDVVWAPAPAPLAVSRHVPLVLTVHDLSFVQRPGDFTAYERLWHRLARPRALAERAARIVAVSAATQTALAECWGLTSPRVRVVRNGVSRPPGPLGPEAIAAVLARHSLDGRYLLFVGALEPRKALDVLVAAYLRARERGLDAELAVAGAGRLARRLGAPGVRLLGHVPRSDLDALYAGAIAVAMPSWLEGFGFPAVEAAAAGTPSVVSDLAVFHETLGEGALRAPPGDVGALADALLRIAADSELRARLAAAAAASVAELTWERAARGLRAALAEAAGL